MKSIKAKLIMLGAVSIVCTVILGRFHTIKDTNRQPMLTNMLNIKKQLKRNARNPTTQLSICHCFFKILLLN